MLYLAYKNEMFNNLMIEAMIKKFQVWMHSHEHLYFLLVVAVAIISGLSLEIMGFGLGNSAKIAGAVGLGGALLYLL